MKKVIAIVLFMCIQCQLTASQNAVVGYFENRWNEWTWFNTVNTVAFEAAIYTDMKQTLYFTKPRKVLTYNGYKMEPLTDEMNPLLGDHPSPRKIKTAVATAMIVQPIISFLLPRDYRNFWQGVTLSVELHAVYLNSRHGYTVRLAYGF